MLLHGFAWSSQKEIEIYRKTNLLISNLDGDPKHYPTFQKIQKIKLSFSWPAPKAMTLALGPLWKPTRKDVQTAAGPPQVLEVSNLCNGTNPCCGSNPSNGSNYIKYPHNSNISKYSHIKIF